MVAWPRISVLVTIRYDWALPSKPSRSRSRCRASWSRTRSPRWPNGGWPEVVRQGGRLDHVGVAAAQLLQQVARAAPAIRRSAMARPTWATFRLCVSRLCTSRPAPPGLITWVTPPSRAKNGELTIRSRSTRNGLGARSPGATRLSPKRRWARGSSMPPKITGRAYTHDAEVTLSTPVAEPAAGRPNLAGWRSRDVPGHWSHWRSVPRWRGRRGTSQADRRPRQGRPAGADGGSPQYADGKFHNSVPSSQVAVASMPRILAATLTGRDRRHPHLPIPLVTPDAGGDRRRPVRHLVRAPQRAGRDRGPTGAGRPGVERALLAVPAGRARSGCTSRRSRCASCRRWTPC